MGLNLPTLALAKKYTDLKTSVTDKQINAAVNQYLENNPVSPGASPEESAQIGANKQNITNLQNEIVMRSPAIITEAIGTGKVRMDDSSFDWLFLYAIGAIESMADFKSVRCRFKSCGGCVYDTAL